MTEAVLTRGRPNIWSVCPIKIDWFYLDFRVLTSTYIPRVIDLFKSQNEMFKSQRAIIKGQKYFVTMEIYDFMNIEKQSFECLPDKKVKFICKPF